MSLQSLSLAADASATQPHRKRHSPFSPLVGWLATLWEPENRETAKMDHVLVHDPGLFISPVSSSNAPPTIHTTDTAGMTTLHAADDDDDVPDMRISLTHPHKHGLTKEEFDYVVNSLLEYLEEAELASPESGYEEYEYYAPENTERRLHYGPWCAPFIPMVALIWCSPSTPFRSPESPLYLENDSEDEGDLSEADTLEMDEVYDRESLELVRTSCRRPIHVELVSGLVFLCHDYS